MKKTIILLAAVIISMCLVMTSCSQAVSEEVLPSGKLVIIEGADHLFEDEYGEMMVEDACEKIASWNC